MMLKLAHALDVMFNGDLTGPARKTGFVLLLFPFSEIGDGGEGRCNFISNGADRGDIVVLFKEMIKRFEGQPDMRDAGYLIL
jgi:hypothetical protein